MRLVRRDGPEGERDYLGDEGVHCGEALEVQLANGTWLPGRYEIAHLEIDGRYVKRAILCVSFTAAVGSGGSELESSITLSDRHVVRRPER